MNRHLKRYTGQSLRGSQVQQLQSQWSWVHHLLHVDVFVLLEVLCTPYCWDFMEAFSGKHDQLYYLYFQLLCPLFEAGVGREIKIPSF